MYTIAIDCGASFIKGALFDNDFLVKTEHRKSPAVHYSDNILNPIQLLELVPLIENLIVDLANGINKFKLCISNEMHGFVLMKKDGSLYTDYISWQKEYGNEVVDGITSLQILSSPEYKDDILHSGMPLRGGLPSCNLLYLKRKKIIDDSDLYFYCLGDYIIRMLSGKEPICHPTNAASTGLYDLSQSCWNKKLLSVSSTSNIIFPVVGFSEMEFVFKGHHIQCMPAIGDQQAALLGAGVELESDISFNLGTGAQVSRLMTNISFSAEYQTRPFFRGLYLMSVPHLPSGRALNVYTRFIKDILNAFGTDISDAEMWQILLKQERSCENTNLQCDLSFFQTPISDHVVGNIDNIGEYDLTLGALMKAILKRMANNFISVANSIYPNKLAIKRIVFSGGVARRIEALRTEILNNYNYVKDIIVAEDETLKGLNIYSHYEG